MPLIMVPRSAALMSRAAATALSGSLSDRCTESITFGPPGWQIQLAMFLISQKSNHVSGKIVHVKDDWQRLEQSNVHPEIYTLRRVQKLNG